RKFRWRDLPGAVVLHLAFILVVGDFVKRFRPLDGGAGDGLVAALRILLQIHLRKERGQLVILILRPTLEWMIMALVAVEARREEEMRRVLHRLRRRAQDLVVTRRRVLPI